MDKEAKRQYMETLRKRYFKASKKEKGKILNEYCGNTKQERKYVIKRFKDKVKLKTKENRKKRARFYDGRVIAVLIKIWKIFDYPCGQRLEEILETETENLLAWGEIICSDEIAKKLKKENLKFSRFRPYHKNDNCFIEQKNSTHMGLSPIKLP
ncbi:MAG: hypothetical protein V1649_00935 [Patescibacteria group bacterium]